MKEIFEFYTANYTTVDSRRIKEKFECGIPIRQKESVKADNTLSVKFSGKEREIKRKNINKNTPQVENILADLKTLEVKTDSFSAK